MELNGYRLLLPEGTLDYFDLFDVKEDLLATERKILNNNRVIKAFTLSILICILLRNDIFLLKVEYNFIYAFLHINKIKVV